MYICFFKKRKTNKKLTVKPLRLQLHLNNVAWFKVDLKSIIQWGEEAKDRTSGGWVERKEGGKKSTIYEHIILLSVIKVLYFLAPH